MSHLKISEENQIELSRLECKEYLDYTVKPMKIDELNIRVDSTQSVFFSLVHCETTLFESERKYKLCRDGSVRDGEEAPPAGIVWTANPHGQ